MSGKLLGKSASSRNGMALPGFLSAGSERESIAFKAIGGPLPRGCAGLARLPVIGRGSRLALFRSFRDEQSDLRKGDQQADHHDQRDDEWRSPRHHVVKLAALAHSLHDE